MRPLNTEIVGSISGDWPIILKSLSRRTALVKSPTSIAARIASFSATRCNSSGSVPSAPSTVRKASTASGHLPWRANASARHNGASF